MYIGYLTQTFGGKMDSAVKLKRYVFFAVCIAINLGLGALVAYLKLPIFLDTLGTIMATILTGLTGGLFVGIITVVFAAVIYSPTIIGYVFTAITIVIVTHLLNKNGFFKSLPKAFIGGLLLGICSAMISAPITVYLWGGISLTGQDFITAFIKATGEQLLKSVVLAGLSTDPIDKIISCVVVFFVLKNVPQSFKESLKPRNE